MDEQNKNLTVAIKAHFNRIEAAAAATAESLAAEAAVEQMEEAQEEAEHHHQQQPQQQQQQQPQQQQQQSPFPTAKTHRYKIQDTFLDVDLYWKEKVRGSRFESSFKIGVLYRPQVVDQLAEIVEEVLAKPVAEGIMVKGPGGIGKSHSLVNLVHKLVYGSDNKYLVTFIPDCEKWSTVYDLLDAICASFGMSSDEISSQIQGNDVVDGGVLKQFIAAVDGILKSMDKQWVFIFDQINKLFVKPLNLQATDASGLAFPYNYIKLIMKPGRITSIISASANNELSHKERHEGFHEFCHEATMTKVELCTYFDAIHPSNVDTIFGLTSGVPLYVASYVLEFDFNQTEYEAARISEVRHSIRKLKVGPHWEEVKKATLSSMLQLDTTEDVYDKKFFVQQKKAGQLFLYRPLIPQVTTACRSFLWGDLMSFVAKKEATLLDICADASTNNRVRGCHFETMVIQRCSCRDMSFQVGEDSITFPVAPSIGFGGTLFPGNVPTDCLYYPHNPNFPAIDFFIKVGQSVFAFQVHVSSHDDVTNKFLGMCAQAGWFTKFSSIHLIYLSPEKAVADLVSANVVPPSFTGVVTRESDGTRRHIMRRAMSRDLITCLKDLQWPDGCSIDSS